MEGYTLEQYYDSTFLVEHPSFTDKKVKHVIYYPCFDIDKLCSKNGIYKDWYFEIEEYPENENEEKEYSEWYLTESEQEVLKDLVRKENPSDLVQFEFLDWGANTYLVYGENKNDKRIRYIVAYPTKDNDYQWQFYCEVDKEEGNYELEDWNLDKEKKQAIKDYIRNVLKPNDLCEEGKEIDMKEGYENLNVAVPKEYATEVMNIITRFDGFKTPPTTEQDCAACMQKNNIPGDQNAMDVMKITELEEQLSNTKKNASELIKHILEEVKGEMDYESYEEMLRTLTKEEITEFGLEEYEVKPKLKKTKYKVTKEVTSYIEVITREGENPLDCISYHEDDSEFKSLFESGEDETSYSYSEEDEDNLTYETAANFLDDVIIDSDLDREIRY